MQESSLTVSSLQLVASRDSIDAAWQTLVGNVRKRSRNTSGVDGVSINDVLRDPKPRLRSISNRVRTGNYAFSSLNPHLIPKPSGKNRLICVPTVDDRIAQRALLDFLTQEYRDWIANPINYGFVKGRRVEDAANRACQLRAKNRWVFKTDISSFFDRINRDLLWRKVRQHIRHSSLHPLLIAASRCEIDASRRADASRVSKIGIKPGFGIRQGMPLSPFFANIFLANFDKRIQQENCNAIRYADDIIFFADSEKECFDLQKFCQSLLDELELEIPEIGLDSKSQIIQPSETAEFLGLGLQLTDSGYELALTTKQKEKIKMELGQLGSIKELLARRITLGSLGQAIDSRVSGYLNAYSCCTNFYELENELHELKQKIFRRVYGSEGLAINIKALSREKRAFLGLD